MVKEQLQLFWQLQTLEGRIEEAAEVALFLGEAGKLVVVHFFWAWLGRRW